MISYLEQSNKLEKSWDGAAFGLSMYMTLHHRYPLSGSEGYIPEEKVAEVLLGGPETTCPDPRK